MIEFILIVLGIRYREDILQAMAPDDYEPPIEDFGGMLKDE